MNFLRFFVTCVGLIATLGLFSCGGKRDKKREADPIQLTALKNEVKTKWDESDVLSRDLQQSYKIMILDSPYRLKGGTFVSARLMGQKFNWNRLTLVERQAAKEKLAQFVTLISRLVEIDAKRGVLITNMDKVRSRYDGALAFQESLSQFENLMGEQFEPKNSGLPPVYYSPVDI